MTNGLTDGMSTFTPFSQYIPENCLEEMKADRPTLSLRNVFFFSPTTRRAERSTNTEIRGKGLTAEEEAENNIGRGGERGEREGASLAISSGQNSRRREGRIFFPNFFLDESAFCARL